MVRVTISSGQQVWGVFCSLLTTEYGVLSNEALFTLRRKGLDLIDVFALGLLLARLIVKGISSKGGGVTITILI